MVGCKFFFFFFFFWGGFHILPKFEASEILKSFRKQ